DIGAYTGVYSLVACAANPRARVVTFEPVPRIYRRLVANLELNQLTERCQAHNMAVSNRTGSARLHVPHTALPGSSSLSETGFRNLPGQPIDIATTAIDDAIAEDDRVDLIKLDVEGFEHHALQGMERVLGRDRPALIFECNPDGPHREVETLLRRHEYLFFHLRERGPVRMHTLVPDPDERYRNYACAPAENEALLAVLGALLPRQ
ncbi:MAG: FkbM family methyltransferase, partial [Myxococcota bacterium]